MNRPQTVSARKKSKENMGNREGYVVGILFYRLDKKASFKKKNLSKVLKKVVVQSMRLRRESQREVRMGMGWKNSNTWCS